MKQEASIRITVVYFKYTRNLINNNPFLTSISITLYLECTTGLLSTKVMPSPAIYLEKGSLYIQHVLEHWYL